VLVDVEDDALTFRAIEGFEPPPGEELAEAGPAD
jgi:hypothetical protein